MLAWRGAWSHKGEVYEHFQALTEKGIEGGKATKTFNAFELNVKGEGNHKQESDADHRKMSQRFGHDRQMLQINVPVMSPTPGYNHNFDVPSRGTRSSMV